MEQLTTADGQVVMGVSPQVQVMQMNTGQVIQGANGQQIVVHTVPNGGQLQLASPTNSQGLQQIQVGTPGSQVVFELTGNLACR